MHLYTTVYHKYLYWMHIITVKVQLLCSGKMTKIQRWKINTINIKIRGWIWSICWTILGRFQHLYLWKKVCLVLVNVPFLYLLETGKPAFLMFSEGKEGSTRLKFIRLSSFSIELIVRELLRLWLSYLMSNYTWQLF